MVDRRSRCSVSWISISSRCCLHSVNAKKIYVILLINLSFVVDASILNLPADVLGTGIAPPYEAIEEVLLVLARLWGGFPAMMLGLRAGWLPTKRLLPAGGCCDGEDEDHGFENAGGCAGAE